MRTKTVFLVKVGVDRRFTAPQARPPEKQIPTSYQRPVEDYWNQVEINFDRFFVAEE